LLGQEPRERFGHRLHQRGIVIGADVVACEQAEARSERGALRLVAALAVHALPRDERVLRLGQAEEAPVVRLPLVTELGALDRRERGFLGAVVGIEATRFVPVPAPRRALDARAVEDAEIGRETLEVGRARMSRDLESMSHRTGLLRQCYDGIVTMDGRDSLAERFQENRTHLRAAAVRTGAAAEVRGAAAVAETFSGRARAAEPALVNGAPGLVWAPGGRPRVVFEFTIASGKIVEIRLVADPERLRQL
jgi:hypothetical protein